jgi:hypothetical protein
VIEEIGAIADRTAPSIGCPFPQVVLLALREVP